MKGARGAGHGARGTVMLGVFTGTLLIATSYGSAWLPDGVPAWGTWCMVIGCAALLASATALGAIRSGVRRSVVVAITVFLFVIVTAGFGLPLVLPPDGPDAPLLLGLPVRTAIEVYGVGLLPLLVLPVLFAIEFKRDPP